MNPNSAESPQLEQGYTRIANALLEGILLYPFTGGELKVIFAVIRSTYGWNRKESVLYIAELAKMAGLSQRHTKRLLQQLAKDQILTKKPITRMRIVMGINKQFSTWRYRGRRVARHVPAAKREASP